MVYFNPLLLRAYAGVKKTNTVADTINVTPHMRPGIIPHSCTCDQEYLPVAGHLQRPLVECCILLQTATMCFRRPHLVVCASGDHALSSALQETTPCRLVWLVQQVQCSQVWKLCTRHIITYCSSRGKMYFRKLEVFR